MPETEEEEMEPELENSLKMMGEEEKKVSPMERLWVSWDKKTDCQDPHGEEAERGGEKDVERGKRMRRRRGKEGDEIVSLSQHMLNKQ